MSDEKFLDVGKVESEQLKESNSRYVQSANTLFRFLDKYSFLEEIISTMSMTPRYVEEKVDYLKISRGAEALSEIVFPMLCFCDINIHKLEKHTEIYGNYAIGLNKGWCEYQGIQPITYLNENSLLSETITTQFNQSLNRLESEELSDVEAEVMDNWINMLLNCKPLKGTMERDGKYIRKNFHDECEWRYIPKFENTEMDFFMSNLTDSERLTKNSRILQSEALKEVESAKLKLSIDDIKYIIVKTSIDKKRLLELITKSFSNLEHLEMASKVLVFEEILEDW